MTLCLFEDAAVAHLFPLALTRAVADLRVGARTLAEVHVAAFRPDRLAFHTRVSVAGVTAQEHLEAVVNAPLEGGVLFVNARWLAREGAALAAIRAAVGGEPRVFVQSEHGADTLVAAWHPAPPPGLLAHDTLGPDAFFGAAREDMDGAVLIGRLWDLIADVPARVAHDVEAMGGLGTHDGADVQDGARLVFPERIHLAPGATVRPGAILNAEDGPIRLEAGATVEEHAVGRGPLWLGAGARIKMAGCVDGSAVGPHSKAGGEVHESIVHSFSNKGHDGYLGNSYLGRWCNLGAGTDTSNLKNDYGQVTVYDAVARDFLPSGRQFAGLFMGDHSKCAIHTAFNTGTVVGVSCNLFGADFPPRHVPSFVWGGAVRFVTYRTAKALRVAEAVMARRGLPLSDADSAMLEGVFEATRSERSA